MYTDHDVLPRLIQQHVYFLCGEEDAGEWNYIYIYIYNNFILSQCNRATSHLYMNECIYCEGASNTHLHVYNNVHVTSTMAVVFVSTGTGTGTG